MIKYFVIFLAIFVADIIWTLYIKWAADGKAAKAGFASIFIYIVSAFTFGEFVKDAWVLIPASLGAFFGTYCTIKASKYFNI